MTNQTLISRFFLKVVCNLSFLFNTLSVSGIYHSNFFIQGRGKCSVPVGIALLGDWYF